MEIIHKPPCSITMLLDVSSNASLLTLLLVSWKCTNSIQKCSHKLNKLSVMLSNMGNFAQTFIGLQKSTFFASNLHENAPCVPSKIFTLKTFYHKIHLEHSLQAFKHGKFCTSFKGFVRWKFFAFSDFLSLSM